jgi:hypothetical protein
MCFVILPNGIILDYVVKASLFMCVSVFVRDRCGSLPRVVYILVRPGEGEIGWKVFTISKMK